MAHVSKNTKKSDSFDNKYLMVWYDNLKGVKLDKTNAADVAKWIGTNARVVAQEGVNLVCIATNRGDVIMAIGDYITIDADKRFKIVRISDADLSKRAISSVAGVPLPSALNRSA